MKYAIECANSTKYLVERHPGTYTVHRLIKPNKEVFVFTNKELLEDIFRPILKDIEYSATSNKEILLLELKLKYKSISFNIERIFILGDREVDLEMRLGNAEVLKGLNDIVTVYNKSLFLLDNHGRENGIPRYLHEDILDKEIIQLVCWGNASVRLRGTGAYSYKRNLILDGKEVELLKDGQSDGCSPTDIGNISPRFMGHFLGYISDDTGVNNIAEVWGNTIFVYFDLSHADNNFLTLISFIIHKAYKLMNVLWETEDIEELIAQKRKEEEELRKERALNVLIDQLNKRGSEELVNKKNLVLKREQELTQIVERHALLLKEVEEAHFELKRILDNPYKIITKEDIRGILEKINVNKKVSTVELIKNEIHITVNDIRTKGKDTPLYYLGDFTIIYDILGKLVYFNSKSDQVKIRKNHNYENDIHPHLFDGGSNPCWGNIGLTINKLVEKGDFTTLVSLCIQFLQSSKYDYKLSDWYTVEEAIKKGLIVS